MRNLCIAIGAVVAALCAHGDIAWPIETTSEAKTGVWMNDFAAATNLAFSTKAPMVLFWANEQCEYCEALEAAINSAEFKAWQREHPYYVYNFVFASGGKDLPPNAGSGAKEFAQTAGGTLSKLNYYPFVCLYWPRTDGRTLATRYLGRAGQMNAAAYNAGKSLAGEFAACLEAHFAGYVPDLGPDKFSFVVSDTDYDRLEAEPTTPYVDVPIAREIRNGGAVTNRLVAAWPDAMLPAVTNVVAWSPAETQKLVRVSLARGGAAFPAGKVMALTLTDQAGEASANGAVHFVEAQPNSVMNPKFVGEPFDYGEWTMDYEAAKAKGGHVLAYFAGVLWCPYCYGMENSLLAAPEFKAWAASNRVSLVLFDQSRASTPATAAGSGEARLLSYTAGTTSLPDRSVASGAAYLSRKAISASAAASRIAMTTRFTAQWLAPGSTAARLGNPTFLLVKNDRVAGRLSSWRDADKVYDPAENIARLGELLLLAARDGEANDYADTTARTLGQNGRATVAYQVNDRNECFLLTGFTTGALAVTATGARDVSLEVLADGESVASGVNSLTLRLRKAHIAASRLVLKTSGAMPDRLDGAASAFSAAIAVSFEPGDDSEQVSLAARFQSSAVLTQIDTSGVKSATVQKRTGALPSGMRLVYDKATGQISLSGTPKKPGTYRFSYVVTTRTSEGKTVSEPAEVVVTVSDPTLANPFLGARQSITVPLVAGSALVGTLEVSASATGRVSAKHTNALGKRKTYSGTWGTFDEAAGTATATLTAKGSAATVVLGANGTVSARVDGQAGEASLAGDVRRFDGYYTVTLPVVETTAPYPCTGTGYLVVTLKKGRATARGYLPNGTAISQSASVAADPVDGDYALMPILRHTSKDSLAALLRIRADGASLYADETTVRVVRAAPGVDTVWSHYAKGDAFTADLAAYGGYFVKRTALDRWLDIFGLDTVTPAIDGEATGISYRYAAATGLVSASLRNITLANGTTASGTVRAVLMPGWLDCGCAEEEFPGQYVERPFASGAFLYKTKHNGRSVTASVPFDLIAQ